MRTVFAYLDPGTGSMVLQIIVGGVAAVGVAGRYYWQRMTGKGPKKPGTDEQVQPETPAAKRIAASGSDPAGPIIPGVERVASPRRS